MRLKYLRELRRIDEGSYGVTLPKQAVKAELSSGNGDEIEHDDVIAVIETSTVGDGVVFGIELHHRGDVDVESCEYRELRKIDTTSYGVTLPKSSLKRLFQSSDGGVEYDGVIASIELEECGECFVFEVELHDNTRSSVLPSSVCY